MHSPQLDEAVIVKVRVGVDILYGQGDSSSAGQTTEVVFRLHWGQKTQLEQATLNTACQDSQCGYCPG